MIILFIDIFVSWNTFFKSSLFFGLMIISGILFSFIHSFTSYLCICRSSCRLFIFFIFNRLLDSNSSLFDTFNILFFVQDLSNHLLIVFIFTFTILYFYFRKQILVSITSFWFPTSLVAFIYFSSSSTCFNFCFVSRLFFLYSFVFFL